MEERSATYEGPPDCVINRAFAQDHFNLNKFPARTYEYRVLLRQLLDMIQPTTNLVHFLPVDIVKTYVPRPHISGEIELALARDTYSNMTRLVLLLHGLGGAGKSQLARRIVEDHRSEFETIFWIDARSTASVRSSFVRFASQAGIKSPDNHDGDESIGHLAIVKSVMSWFIRHNDPGTRWLMILDDADDMSERDLKDIVPQLEGGTIIITSRNPLFCNVYLADGLCIPIDVGPLETNESSGLVLQHLHIDLQSASDELQYLSALIGEMLGNLALAVDLAGAYVAEQFLDDAVTTLKIYMSDFQTHKDYLLKRKPFLKRDSYEPTIWTVWDRSLRTIQEKHPNVYARQFLIFVSAFEGSLVQDELFQVAGGRIMQVLPPSESEYYDLPCWLLELTGSTNGTHASLHLREAQKILARYSLIQLIRGPKPGVKVHSLVQWRARQDQDAEVWADWSAVFLTAIAYHLTRTRKDRELREAFLPHLTAADNAFRGIMDQVGRRRDPWTAFYFETTAELMTDSGHWALARNLLEQSLCIRQTKQGVSHYDSINLVTKLGTAFKDQGRWGEAVDLLEWALSWQWNYYGENNPQTLYTMTVLGETYGQLGRLAESEQMQSHVLSSRELDLGTKDKATISSMNSLASSYLSQGQTKRAEELLLKAIQLYHELDEAEVGAPAEFRSNLAVAYTQQRRFNEALAIFAAIIEEYKATLGETDHQTLVAISNLAHLHKDIGNLDQAESLFRYLVQVRTKLYGPSHYETLDSSANIASILFSLDRTTEALEIMTHCAVTARTTLGPNHPYTGVYEGTLYNWQHPETLLQGLKRGFKLFFTVIFDGLMYPYRLLCRLLQQSNRKSKEISEIFRLPRH